MLRAAGLLFLIGMLAQPAQAGEIELRVPKTTYRAGERVLAVIKAPGKVGIESDIAQQSFEAQIGGSKEVDLGPIRRPGLYNVRIVSGQQATMVMVFAYAEGSQLRLEASTWATGKVLPLSKETLDRFTKGITRERLSDCARMALLRWLPANVSSVGGTATFCMVCVVPGSQMACPACVSSAGGNVVDLGLEVLTELTTSMEKAGILLPEEAKLIRGVIHSGRGAVSILNAGGKLERVVEGVNFAVQTVVEEGNVTLVVGNVAGEVNKTSLLIKVFRK